MELHYLFYGILKDFLSYYFKNILIDTRNSEILGKNIFIIFDKF
jgi:hypothetical protein